MFVLLSHRATYCLAVGAGLLARPGWCQELDYLPFRQLDSSAAATGQSPQATLVKMTLHPAAAPRPALGYALLPEVRDLKPGNAALLYQRAQNVEWWHGFDRAGQGAKMANLLDLTLAKMPRDKVVLLPTALRELELAARREYCDWEMTPRFREEGFTLAIPDVQGFRLFGNMLALRTRLELLDGQVDRAVNDLQTGLAFSRHVAEAPLIVNALVGMALAHAMFDRVEELIQLDKAPNLYWALADLPRPFIDLRRPMQGEKVGIASVFPGIRAALGDPSQPAVPIATIHKYLDNLRYLGDRVAGERLTFTLMAARTYPAAKSFLLAKGFSPEQIDALPVIQVSLMHGLAVIDDCYDEVYKWQNFPYWQARPGMARAQQKFAQLRTEKPETTYLASMLMPALNNVVFARARLDRRVALLQVVEALRLHAAAEGKLPDQLEDVRAVPLPTDPVTGRSFEYTLEGNRAVLYAPPPPGETVNDRNAIRYELILASASKR
jgi:hypothetical protein